MKKLIVFVALGLSAASMGIARAAPPTFYVEADLVKMSQKNTDGSGNARSISGTSKTTNLRLRGGIHALSWLDAELHVILPRTGKYNDSAGGNVTLKTAVVGVFAKPNLDVGAVNIYGLAGLANVSSDLTSATIGGTAHHTKFSIGAGAQISITKNLSVTADYVQYHKDIDYGASQKNTVTAAGIGVKYMF
ncbi:MAG: porin family protein [Gammaproteobacteria bacterium]|nr:porin family protein [Gammaproteobacteria bacterium]